MRSSAARTSCAQIPVSKTGSLTGELLSSVADYLLWYCARPEAGEVSEAVRTESRGAAGTTDRVLGGPPASSGGASYGNYVPDARSGTKATTVRRCAENRVTWQGHPGRSRKSTLRWHDRLARVGHVPWPALIRRFWQDFPVTRVQQLVDSALGGASDARLRRPDEHQDHRALPPDDHRPRRSRARSDLRLRHDSLRRRAVGPALDHDRHEPRRPRARPHAPHVGALPVLPPRRLARGTAQGGRAGRPAGARRPDRGRHPPGLRVRAGAARHPEVDRPEPRHPRRA